MPRTFKARLAALFLPFAAMVALIAPVPSAGAAAAANPTLHVVWNLDATTHLAKLNQTVKAPRGSLTADIDLVTGNFTGSISIPPAKSTVKLAGLPLADATFQMVQAKPVTGHVDLATFKVTTTSSFNIRVLSLRPHAIVAPNLVGPWCKTSRPITIAMNGTASLTAASTFKGTYTIPPFQWCTYAVTRALNLSVSGPNNTFTATASPPAA